MYNDSLSLENSAAKIIKSAKQSKAHINLDIRFEGHNEDLVESYFWIFNFAYYTGKGYTTLKLEDYHYFSESNQYGMQLRQVKGGSARAFQENMNQLIQLIKVHLMPLLQEVKQADFYNTWIEKIVKSDKIVQEELSKKGNLSDNKRYNDAKNERDEAISHLKDKWVNEVEGGKIWQMSRSATEQGLDFSLLPQLFFGTNLENPLYEYHKSGKTLKEQLDQDIYSIDITQGAKEQVARQMYKFYMWLPTAIRDTQVTFKLKVAALKNIYSQVQMNINIIKPLLVEITRKTEGFDKENFYRDFENENPEFVNLFDTSYLYVRNLGIRNFGKKERGDWTIDNLEISQYGLFLKNEKDIIGGEFKKKGGYIISEDGKGQYEFLPTDIGPEKMTRSKFEELKQDAKKLDKEHLKKFPIMEIELMQKRRTEVVQSPQGPQQVPFMKNQIKFNGYAWNIFEIATHRAKLKEKNLDLLETFISEIKEIKEDLLNYVGDFETRSQEPPQPSKTDSKEKEKKKEKSDNTLILGPIQGLYEIFKPLMPTISIPKQTKKDTKKGISEEIKNKHLIVQLSIIEDTWKVYTIYKKSHKFIQV